MINEAEIITEVEQVLAEHWAEIHVADALIAKVALQVIAQQAATQPQAQPDNPGMATFKDVLIVLLAGLLLLAVLGRLA